MCIFFILTELIENNLKNLIQIIFLMINRLLNQLLYTFINNFYSTNVFLTLY